VQTHVVNPLNTELNPICHLLELLGAHHIVHFSRVRVNPHKQPDGLPELELRRKRQGRREAGSARAAKPGPAIVVAPASLLEGIVSAH